MAEIKLPFGLRDGRLVHISQVDRGLACRCTCPGCAQPLVAKQGQRTVQHFAHAQGADCPHAVETALHLAAKEVLYEERAIAVPAFELQFVYGGRRISVARAQRVVLDEVKLEAVAGNIRPDLIATVRGQRLAVEVFVTHKSDLEKERRFRSLRLSAIEIDLSGVARDFSRAGLRTAVVDSTDNKRWLFNCAGEYWKNEFKATGDFRCATLRQGELHIDNCPLRLRTHSSGQHYAMLGRDCRSCDYCFGLYNNGTKVLCGGRLKIASVEQLKALQGQSLNRPHEPDLQSAMHRTTL